jgi:serine protease AprX
MHITNLIGGKKLKMNRKVLVAIMILGLSLVAVSAKPEKATIHVQTFGYEGRDILKLNVEITGEDSNFIFFSVNAGVLNKVAKDINVEKLPIVQINETMFKIPRISLTEIDPNEYIMIVPNNVTKMKWNIKDKIKNMDPNNVVDVLVWFKTPGLSKKVSKFGNVSYEFASGMGAAMEIRVFNIKALSEMNDIMFVEEDGVRHVTLSDSIPLINADDVWSMGYDGSGTTICIVDTGIDPNHCDFPSGKIIAWADYVGSGSSPYDDHGHGTCCASIAAGEDTPKGVAPGASLIGAKVCTSGGQCTDSNIISGIDFGVAQGADIVNISLGGPGGDGTSAVAQECNWAVDQGVVVVCAAGNDGPSLYTINTPGDATKVITVGTSDKSDGLASFSSRGPTADERIKPDIVAPGVSINAARAGTACSDIGMSGSSMATSHISGVVALMLDACGSATPLQVKNCLGSTAIDKGVSGKDINWGWGRVDAYAAVQCIVNFEITDPQDEQLVSCTELITVSANCPQEITFVEFKIDGSWIDSDDEAPFECEWDTCLYSSGPHTITALGYTQEPLAYSGSGEILDVPTYSDEITVQVNNDCIAITNPLDGAEAYGIVNITTSSSCCFNYAKLYIYKVGENPGNPVDIDFITPNTPYIYSWDTTSCEEDQQYTILLEAFHHALYQEVLLCPEEVIEVTVTVNNYNVEIANPPDGAVVSGTITITTTTEDTRGVNEVQFYIGEYNLGSDTNGPPFELVWDTTLCPNGEHTLTAKGFVSIDKKAEDTINCTISNESMVTFIGLFFGAIGFVIWRY